MIKWLRNPQVDFIMEKPDHILDPAKTLFWNRQEPYFGPGRNTHEIRPGKKAL